MKQTNKKQASTRFWTSHGTKKEIYEDGVTVSEPEGTRGGSETCMRVLRPGAAVHNRKSQTIVPRYFQWQRFTTKGASDKDLPVLVSVCQLPPFCTNDPRDPGAASGRSSEAD